MRLTAAIFAISLAFVAAPWAPTAEAARSDARTETRNPTVNSRPAAGRPASSRPAPPRTTSSQRAAARPSPGISCVPYARQVTGMRITGNGREWWNNAAGRYARGNRPEPGSILSFPASGNMRLGHVAVVARVIEPRVIEIDHANWGGPGIRRGQVMRGVRVQDVSGANDWTQVRVQVGWTAGTFGRVYPTHGFIHNRAVGSNEMMATATPAGRPAATRPTTTRQAPARQAATARPAAASAQVRPATDTTPTRVANRPIQQASAAH